MATKAELLKKAEELGLDVTAEATVPEIKAAIKEAESETTQTEPETTPVVGGDGLVDSETTHGEDVKGSSTFDKSEKGDA